MPCGNRVLAATVSLALFASPLAAQTPSPSDQPVRTQHAMVVTIHHDATDAGVEILKQGGNAVDAAVAVGFALAVVYPAAGNIGGGGFMLIRDHSGKTHFIDYREKAPAATTRDMYLDAQGNVIPDMSLVGYKASGVPGSVAGLAYAQKHYGKLTLAQDMTPAIKLASDGYTLSAEEARALHSKSLSGFPVSAKIFQRDGDFYREGDTFKQPELAATLTRISKDPDDFYKGAMAHQLADFERAGGGLITAEDLAAYQVKERVPIRGKYHGFDLITAPPPSSGGIILIEILNILSTYDLPKLGPDRSAAQVHIIAEAFRRAYKDRGDYLGDPDFNTLPIKQMANPKYAAAWRSSIDPSKPTPSKDLVRPAGFMPPPPQAAAVKESTQTTHFSIVDADGNAVSSTYTLNGGFGSGVTVEGLGFLMNNEMDDFTSKVGVPNVYGLIQSTANSIGPGKRPLSAMTPTILTTPSHWYKPGKLAYVLGTPGGSTIITTVANNIISTIDNGLNIQQAADAPRFHHQYLPDRIDLEKKFSPDVAAQLAAMGYTINRLAVADEHNPGTWGDSELIAIDPKTHELLGGHDNRRAYGKAAGY
ncbi:gamma-glutamyltransferase [Tunturiibacter lichenicola]|uniref:gamma-glutamyltransferase n=1 Tax=Tunturiibacter lichenicola TaxID=2051959 RepID=UPI0021B33631|nr:gamma-glutamyltransferase [Edaphobacter lichenicola]